MKNKNVFILIIIGFVLWIIQKKRAFDSLELRPAFPKNFRLQGTTLVFDLPFNAFNGSSGTLNIGGVDLKVYAENQYIGRAFSSLQQRITPYGQSILTTQVIIYLGDLASAMPGFLNGIQDQAVNMHFRGNINVEGIYANVDVPLSFNLPKFR